MHEEKEFYTVPEFSQKLRVHPQTIRKAIKKGRIQAMRTGVGNRTAYRIPANEVSRLCEMDMSKVLQQLIDDAIDKRMNEKQGEKI